MTDPAALAVLGEAAAFADRHVDALGGVYDSGLEHPAEPRAAPAPAPPRPAPRGGHHHARHGRDGVGPRRRRDRRRRGRHGRGGHARSWHRDDGRRRHRSRGRGRAHGRGGRRLAGRPARAASRVGRRLGARLGAAARRSHGLDGRGRARRAAARRRGARRVGAADLATLVESEDAAGYGYEVRAAQSEGDVRTAAVARAAQHRARAQGWALAAGTDGTPQDPRRVAYALPDDTDPAAFARHVESGLARTYASLVAAAALTSRPRPSRCSRTPGRTPSRGASRPWRSRACRSRRQAERARPAHRPSRRTCPTHRPAHSLRAAPARRAPLRWHTAPASCRGRSRTPRPGRPDRGAVTWWVSRGARRPGRRRARRRPRPRPAPPRPRAGGPRRRRRPGRGPRRAAAARRGARRP